MRKLMFLLLLTACVTGIIVTEVHPSANLKFMFPDVGQGGAALIQTPDGKTIIYDCGRSGSRIFDDLQAFGITSIDLMIVSNPDADHMGGCVDILKTMPVKRLVDNGQTKDTQISQELRTLSKTVPYEAITEDHDDQEFPWLQYLVAYDTWGKFDPLINENSVGMKVTDGNVTVLYTGDCQAKCEATLKDTADINADVYYAGHHGSKTSSTTYALEEITPSVVFIAVGKNSYGHPSPEALQRISAYTDNIFSTQEHGPMVMTTNGNAITVTDSHGLVLWTREAAQE